MTVWVLIFLLVDPSNKPIGVSTIEDLKSKEECLRVSVVIEDSFPYSITRCVEIQKG